MVAIADIHSYVCGMQKSMEDKLCFMNCIDQGIQTVYDFGCADGSLLQSVQSINPELNLIGYDMNNEMIAMAKKNCHGYFYANPVSQLPEHTLLNASSVFYEIHSYGTKESIAADYRSIFHSGADVIAIRDMFYSEVMPQQTNQRFVRMVIDRTNCQRLKQFERIHGSITLRKNFLHYLLKYRYVDNWEREVRENYLPNSLEQFLQNIPDIYEVKYVCAYTLPFLRSRVYQDFGFLLTDATHAKILLKRKEIR